MFCQTLNNIKMFHKTKEEAVNFCLVWQSQSSNFTVCPEHLHYNNMYTVLLGVHFYMKPLTVFV